MSVPQKSTGPNICLLLFKTFCSDDFASTFPLAPKGFLYPPNGFRWIVWSLSSGKPDPDLGYSALLPGWGDSEQILWTAEAMRWLQAFGPDTKWLSAHDLQGQTDYVPNPPPPHSCCQILGILGVRTPVVVSETWIPLKIKNMHSLWNETKDAIISLENVEVNNVMCKRIFSLLLKLWKITVKQLGIYVLMKDLLSNLCTSLY